MTTKDPHLTRADFAAWTAKFATWRKDTDARLTALEQMNALINARLSQLENRKAHPQQAAGATVATDADLTGERGNPKVERNPPRWDGDDMTGRRWSQTSVAFLECMAGFLDWKADNPREGKEKYAQYDRKDAARARAWAARLAPGSTWRADPRDEDPPEADGDDGSADAFHSGNDGDDGIPF